MMEVKEDPQELPQVSPALPVLPQLNFYEQLMQDITENSLARVESHGSSLSTQE
jgi:hypothetical protein